MNLKDIYELVVKSENGMTIEIENGSITFKGSNGMETKRTVVSACDTPLGAIEMALVDTLVPKTISGKHRVSDEEYN